MQCVSLWSGGVYRGRPHCRSDCALAAGQCGPPQGAPVEYYMTTGVWGGGGKAQHLSGGFFELFRKDG